MKQPALQFFLLLGFIVCRVFFRGILRALVPVYQGVMDLLNEVVQCRPMAFLTNFTLPADLEVFLGPPYSDLLKARSTAETFGMKKTTKPSLLDRLFEEGSEEQVEKGGEEERQIMQMLASEEMTSNMDLGRSVLRQAPLCSRKSDFFMNSLNNSGFLKWFIGPFFLFHSSVGSFSNLDMTSMLQQTFKQVVRHNLISGELKYMDHRWFWIDWSYCSYCFVLFFICRLFS